MANLWSKIRGIIGDILTIGTSTSASSLKSVTDGISVRNYDDSADKNIIFARPQGGSQNTHGATYLDVKERAIDIEFAFNGSTYTPGSNNGKYGMCHTSGGVYTAGAVYLEDGAEVDAVPIYKMMVLTSRLTFSGTVGLAEDAIYQAESAVAPYSWTRKGGSPAGSGEIYAVTVPFTFNDIGTPVSSSTSIPSLASVVASTVSVDTAFSGGSAPTCLVEVDGPSTDTVLQSTSDNNLAASGAPNQYENRAVIPVPSGEGGVVRVTLGGTATAGAGSVLVQYVVPTN